MKDSDEGVMRDAAIISAAQKVEHYEIASYGTLRAFAQTLGLEDAARFLPRLWMKKRMLTLRSLKIAESAINIEAAGAQTE